MITLYAVIVMDYLCWRFHFHKNYFAQCIQGQEGAKIEPQSGHMGTL